MKPVEIFRTIYPRLPQVLDEDTLAEIATLESKERAFVLEKAVPRQQYLRALYLKSMRYLGHSRFHPGRLPLQLRSALIDQLGLPKAMVKVRRIDKGEKSRIVQDVRTFLCMKPYNRNVKRVLAGWLAKEVAAEEGDLITVINAAIEYLMTRSIALPSFTVISSAAGKALKVADEALQDKLGRSLDPKVAEDLDEMLTSEGGSRTFFDKLKDAAGTPGPQQILKQLDHIERIESYPLDASFMKNLPRRKLESFALLGWRYHASELRQLKPERHRIIVLCFLRMRRAQMLDTAGELFYRYRNHVNAEAERDTAFLHKWN